jgi:death-on-curing protein
VGGKQLNKPSTTVMNMPDDDIIYPDKKDIISIHDDIVAEDEDASEGIINEGDIDFAINYIQHGHFGNCPETIHEKAVHLIRLLAANHSFVDGNKRTALNTTWTFYLINDYYFDYGEEIKAILKLFAVMERMVDNEEATEYFEDIALPIEEANIAESDEVLVLHKLAENTLRLTTKLEEEAQKEEIDAERIHRLAREAQEYIEKSEEIVRQRDKGIHPEFWDIIDEVGEKVKEVKSKLLSKEESQE